MKVLTSNAAGKACIVKTRAEEPTDVILPASRAKGGGASQNRYTHDAGDDERTKTRLRAPRAKGGVALRNSTSMHSRRTNKKFQLHLLHCYNKTPREKVRRPISYIVTLEFSSSNTMRSTSDITSRTATSIISSAVRRRNASKLSPEIEGNTN